MMTQPDHTISRAIAGSSIPASFRDHFVRRVELIEMRLHLRNNEVGDAARLIESLEERIRVLTDQLLQRDRQLNDARNHRDSLASMLERRQLESEPPEMMP